MGAFLLAALLLTPWPARSAPAASPAPDLRSASAIRSSTTIAIDGRLSEETWLLAPALTDLVQRSPDEGHPGTERTEVRVAYDDDALYIGARLFDRHPNAIVRRLSRRDADSASDVFRVYLDPHHDHKTGVLLEVSAAGSQADAWLSNDFARDPSWDGVWQAAVTVDAEGWVVEMRVPLSQLRFAPGDHQVWGLNVSRYIQRNHEEDWWLLVPSTDTRLVSAFGHLTGIDGIAARRHLALVPYATGKIQVKGAEPAGDPSGRSRGVLGGAGLDIKWGVTSSFTLDGALNPDFGQVEVDPAVVNLTAFETFFQEKRPFFIEGAPQFTTFGRNGLVLYGRFGARYPDLYYSRRVGRAPHLAAEGEQVEQPASTTILGAAKVTGRTAGGWNVSVLDAATDRERARVVDGGVRSTMEVEPPTNYIAARVSRDIDGRGAIGVLATAVNRSLTTAELRGQLASAAYAGGIDANLFVDRKKLWVLSGSFAGSHVRGDAAAIAALQRASARYYERPDAAHLRFDPGARSLSGWTGQINVNRTRGNVLVDGAVWAISPGFESNDVGFSPEADRVGAHTGWVWQKTTPDRWTRERSLSLITRWLWNSAGDNLINGYSLQAIATAKNYWTATAGTDLDLPHLNDRETRGGPLMGRPSSYDVFFGLGSDSRKRVGFDWFGDYAWNTAGGWAFDASPSLVVRPSPSVTVSVGPSLSRGRAVAQYVDGIADATALATYGRRTVFSDLDRTEVSLVSRLNLIFTPRASFEMYAQPLVSAGRYWNLKELARPRAFEFMRYGTDGGTIGYDGASRAYTIDPDGPGPASPFQVAEPDFNYKSLRLSAVFRWEWRLGSTLYAVWTHQREVEATGGEFTLGRDLRSMFRAPGDHVFMVKLACWLGR